MEKFPTQCRVALNLTPAELAALDKFCSDRRRATGELVTRTSVIKLAIADYIEQNQQ